MYHQIPEPSQRNAYYSLADGGGSERRRFVPVSVNIFSLLQGQQTRTMANAQQMFALLLVVLVYLGDVVDSDNFPWCPALVSGCYCRRKYNTDDYIYCENLGNIDRIPAFNGSLLLFKELHFRYNTQVSRIQGNAFRGLYVEQLWLQGVNLTSVDKEAFEGLEDNLTHLNLGDNQLQTVNRNALARLRSLEFLGLHNNMITSVPTLASSLRSFPRLNYLYLFSNNIRQVPLNTFRGMVALKGLKLNNNQISSLRTGVFDPLVELNELELQNNSLSTLPANIFRNLNQLVKLDLSNNRLYMLLTGAFYGLGKLETLHLKNNMLSEFQSGMFAHIKRVKYLTLSHNYASRIEQVTFRRMNNLRVVDLSHNRISRIETMSFRFLYRLERLYLTGNQLTHLDFFVYSLLGKIKILDVSQNNLAQISEPRVFSSLAKLEQLNLGENSIGNLNPGVFARLRLLRVLKLSSNPIFVLRENVLDHLNLEEVDMTDCHLRRIHEKAFRNTRNVKYLWLDNNQLEDIPTRLFNNSENMKILSLKHNNLTKLRREMFKGLSKLETIHLDWNQLNNITDYSFIFLGALRTLTVTHNNISELFEHSFNDLKSLLTLDLSHNRITSIGRSFTRFQNIESIILRGNNLRNVNWYSFFYSSLKKLKLLDLSFCDLSSISLRGLIRALRTPLDEFKLNLVGNPLSCQGCDLSWSSYVPYNSIMSPIDVLCSTPDQYMGKPVFCCLDNPCLDETVKNNSRLHVMCSDAENRRLSATTTTQTPQNLGETSTEFTTVTTTAPPATASTVVEQSSSPAGAPTAARAHGTPLASTPQPPPPQQPARPPPQPGRPAARPPPPPPQGVATTTLVTPREASTDPATYVKGTDDVGSGDADDDWFLNVNNAVTTAQTTVTTTAETIGAIAAASNAPAAAGRQSDRTVSSHYISVHFLRSEGGKLMFAFNTSQSPRHCMLSALSLI